MLTVLGLKRRSELVRGDLISYPEGKLALVVKAPYDADDFGRASSVGIVLQRDADEPYPISVNGDSVTYYGNIFDGSIPAESRSGYLERMRMAKDARTRPHRTVDSRGRITVIRER